MSTATKLITAEEFAATPDDGRPSELVRGEIVERNVPTPRHGQICARIAFYGLAFNEDHDRIHVLSNDSGCITGREPDTVRGPDVCFVSYDRLPKGPAAGGRYLDVAPEIAFEVASPSDSWTQLQVKIGEYLNAGVLVACVVDPATETVQVFHRNRSGERLSGDDALTFPDILPGFSVPVRKLFE